MNPYEEHVPPLVEPPSVVIKIKSSTQRGGGEGYELTVTNQASRVAVEETISRAIEGRTLLLKGLRQIVDIAE